MDKRFIVLVWILLIGVGLSFVFKPVDIDSGIDERVLNLPREPGIYKSKDIELEDRIYDILETKNVVMRHYFKEGELPILFYLIFSKKTHKTSDPPENCLSGEGRAIISKELVELPGFNFPVNKLLVEKSGIKDMYLYWFIAGDEFFDNYVGQRLKLIMSYLKRCPQSGGQIRISTEVTKNNEQAAMKRLEEFIAEMMPYLKELLK
ncbi:MAG: EpsI family protein [Candidatus Omnitrophica bacterium]|nr:EpsI family protein [Candidatus Omnitrophota bacterium]